MSAGSKTQRYGKRHQVCDRMKLHLRVVKLRGTTYRLVSLRPHTEAAFSTNHFHDTWHIVTDRHGARLLGRLLWGLSFQRQGETAILIHGEHIVPTPFGAEVSDPILLMHSDGSPSTQRPLRLLYDNLARLGPSQRTVRWHTFGFDAALERQQRQSEMPHASRDREGERFEEQHPRWSAEHMDRRGGFVCYWAPRAVMRHRALDIAQLDPTYHGMDYIYLADHNECWRANGEVQIFSDYHSRRAAATEARRQTLARGLGKLDPVSLYEVIAKRRDQILQNRRQRGRFLASRPAGKRRRRRFPIRPAAREYPIGGLQQLVDNTTR